MRSREPAGKFEDDARNDQLPTVSWIIPTSTQSEHPDYLPAAGAAFVASKIDAIAANPEVWAKTAFILNYDENDGLFDHVPPPVPPPGTPDEFVGGPAHRRRVPRAVHLVSPWTAGGWVRSEPFDHTSVLRSWRADRRPRAQHHPVAARTFGDLTSALGMGSGRAQNPPNLAGPQELSGSCSGRPSTRSRTCRRRRLRGAQQTSSGAGSDRWREAGARRPRLLRTRPR